MFILFFFAFLAGVATVFSPCILPVLPIVLSGGTGKGKLRPLGITLGLILSFTFFTLSLSILISYLNVSANILRYIAMAIIGFFGLVMIFPTWSQKFSQNFSAIANLGTKIQGAGQKIQSGFWSGFILGVALGLIWTPCAGPILAAITTLVATNRISFSTILITLFYSIGAGIPMFLIAYGGNKVIESSKWLSKHAEHIRQGFGALMVLVALAIAFNWDLYYQQAVLNYIPSYSFDDNSLVKEKLKNLHPKGPSQSSSHKGEPKTPQETMNHLPGFPGITAWLNSQPLTPEQLRGKVVLVDFWTYSCINCIRTLPYLTRWYDTYKDKGLVIVGVHTPEFAFEKDKANVEDAVKRFHIHYPVALDNDYKTWQAFDNYYWPAHYLADQNGIIRMVHFGEGAYAETENAIRELLGLAPLKIVEKQKQELPITHETYLGFNRADRYTKEIQLYRDQAADYHFSHLLMPDEVGLQGKWLVNAESITSEGNPSELYLNFVATRVYLVLGGKSDEPIEVLLDGMELPSKYYTNDMDSKGRIFVKEPRKYDIVNLHEDYGRHTLTLRIPKGIKAYAFTFGMGN